MNPFLIKSVSKKLKAINPITRNSKTATFDLMLVFRDKIIEITTKIMAKNINNLLVPKKGMR